MMDFIFKFLKFGVVGILGMAVDFLITWLCKEKLQFDKYISNSIGFIIAASSNYFFNRVWTFQSTNNQIVKEYSSFLLISIFGLGLNNLIIYVVHEKMKFNFYLAKVIPQFR